MKPPETATEKQPRTVKESIDRHLSGYKNRKINFIALGKKEYKAMKPSLEKGKYKGIEIIEHGAETYMFFNTELKKPAKKK